MLVFCNDLHISRLVKRKEHILDDVLFNGCREPIKIDSKVEGCIVL